MTKKRALWQNNKKRRAITALPIQIPVAESS
jgi:hypothetical protein